jgi:hypothetical protein
LKECLPAIVGSSNEKSRIQALERIQPVRPVLLDRAEQRTHDYVQDGTTTLFAALEVATGRVTDQCHSRHRHQEFLAFLKLVARHPRVQLHFTPTSASWLNLVEVFFSIVERQPLRRGDFASVTDLLTAISRFCAAWNERCQPFAWTKPADET